MRYIILLLFITTYMFSNPYNDVIRYKLDNGLEVYLLPNSKSKNTYIEVEVKVGMGVETKENAGLSHLVEHLIFRDRRVKYHDYYDLITQKGATDVNGYTSWYKTKYITKIDPKHSYWITKTFYKMLFDKNITNEDLNIEKKALQLEIGEPDWTDYISFKFLKKFNDFIENISPKSDYNVYRDDFKIDLKKDKIDYFSSKVYRKNNKKFTLDDALKHYHNYYYPSNMILKIVGNFDANKMKEVINDTFAKAPKSTGKTLKEPIYKDAKLSNKPFIKYDIPGMAPSSRISLGYKYIDDNLTKDMVIDSYFSYLADRLNREFRNKKGESYTVYGSSNTYHNAGLGRVTFSTQHENFEKNFKLAKELLLKESKGDISDKIIKESIENSKKYYTGVSNDVESLLDIIDNEILQRAYYKDKYQNPYDIINSITIKEFKNILKENFKNSNLYVNTRKDYYLFPYEFSILYLLFLIVFFIIFFKLSKKIRKRDIRFKRRLTNIIISFTLFIVIFLIATVASSWVEYFLLKLFGKDNSFIYSPNSPIVYLYIVASFIIFILTYIFILKYPFRWYYPKLFATKDSIILSGPKPKIIDLKDIKSLDIKNWSIDKIFKSYGISLLFWRKLLKITTNDNKEYYLRSFNAKHLKEDIESLMN